MKRKLVYWVIVVCFLPSLSLAATVTRILDGDTLEVTEDSKTLRVRLIDIDAPEKKQPYGQKAKQFLTDFVKDADAVAVRSMGTDRYGRTLAQVYVKKCDSECLSYLVNAEMVKNGYAWAYRYNHPVRLWSARKTKRVRTGSACGTTMKQSSRGNGENYIISIRSNSYGKPKY